MLVDLEAEAMAKSVRVERSVARLLDGDPRRSVDIGTRLARMHMLQSCRLGRAHRMPNP